MRNERWLPGFFAVAACSWMPHWACHYYRLETASGFVVGRWEFSPLDSALWLVVYGALVGLNVVAVVLARARTWAALLTGIGHCAIDLVHIVRLVRPFRFEIFGYPWTTGASAREVVVVIAFGILSLSVAWYLGRGIIASSH